MIILFDLDGTLIDSTEAILESFHYAFDFYGYRHPDDESIKALIGHPLDYMFAKLGVEDEKVWDFVAVYKEHYREISTQKTVLLPHAREAVELAATFAKLGIVTTKTGKYSKVLMEYFGIMNKFKVLIGREHVEHPKPHAEPILKALEAFDIEDKDVWMIGDTQMDMVAAEAAGVNAIAVTSGYDSRDTLKKFTDVVFNDAYEAVKWLKRRKISHT
ncbi:HAD family hydrolase [Sulfurimonas paralvinellae]|uniref:phosphoglycolate phosphatase n=1 Tax=Sulfurimonas paralvinellae TaxID=317658 RepID=A0A7M1B9V9_9BACT|nr:HAD family hydrolase [Sulfurimonas paralvinellae]QOP46483.1 HAD family hydrolase [Sulfurimonas paralvinellae]